MSITRFKNVDVLGNLTVQGQPVNENGSTGWAFYEDSQYTTGSPFVVNSGVTAALPNNKALTEITTQLPPDSPDGFYDGTVITPTNNGDKYTLSIRFKARSSATNGAYSLKLDIGGAQGIISEASSALLRGASAENFVEVDFTVFSGPTFVANGGTLLFESITGNTSIYDIAYLIARDHKGYSL